MSRTQTKSKQIADKTIRLEDLSDEVLSFIITNHGIINCGNSDDVIENIIDLGNSA